MKDKTHKLMELMAAGHDIETIIDILGIDDSELFEMMMELVEISEAASAPAPSAPKIQIPYMTEILRTKAAGKVEVNLN